MGILIAKVISLPGHTGQDFMSDYMHDLAQAANLSHRENIKLNFITAALSLMEVIPQADLPSRNGEPFKQVLTIEVDENTSYSQEFELLKPLARQPIYELRVDLRQYNWYFRATFFPKYIEGQLYYCFVYPFEKIPGQPDPTNYMRDQTYNVFDKVKFHQSDYAHYFNE